jgi:hypothetical protein
MNQTRFPTPIRSPLSYSKGGQGVCPSGNSLRFQRIFTMLRCNRPMRRTRSEAHAMRLLYEKRFRISMFRTDRNASISNTPETLRVVPPACERSSCRPCRPPGNEARTCYLSTGIFPPVPSSRPSRRPARPSVSPSPHSLLNSPSTSPRILSYTSH